MSSRVRPDWSLTVGSYSTGWELTTSQGVAVDPLAGRVLVAPFALTGGWDPLTYPGQLPPTQVTVNLWCKSAADLPDVSCGDQVYIRLDRPGPAGAPITYAHVDAQLDDPVCTPASNGGLTVQLICTELTADLAERPVSTPEGAPWPAETPRARLGRLAAAGSVNFVVPDSIDTCPGLAPLELDARGVLDVVTEVTAAPPAGGVFSLRGIRAHISEISAAYGTRYSGDIASRVTYFLQKIGRESTLPGPYQLRTITAAASGIPITNRAALAALDTALINGQAVKVVCVGDSITEGTGAPTFATTWPALLQARLRARYRPGQTGGAGYIPTTGTTGGALPVLPLTRTAGPLEVPSWAYAAMGWLGMGGRTAVVSQAGDSIEYAPQVCDRIRVHWGKGDFIAGNLRIMVDGATVGTVLSAATPASDGWVIDYPLTRGSHVVRFEAVNPGWQAFPEGVTFYDGDSAAPIHVYNAAHYGLDIAGFATANMTAGHWAAVAAVAPTVTIINLGTNDRFGNAAQSLTALDQVISKTTGPVLLLVPWRPGDITTPGQLSNWQTLTDGIRARATGRVAVWDLAAAWDTSSQTLMLDLLHPSPTGHQRIAELLETALTTPTTTTLLTWQRRAGDLLSLTGGLSLEACHAKRLSTVWEKSRDESTNVVKLSGFAADGSDAAAVASWPDLVTRYGPHARAVTTQIQTPAPSHAAAYLPAHEAAIPAWRAGEIEIYLDSLTDEQLDHLAPKLYPHPDPDPSRPLQIPMHLVGIAARDRLTAGPDLAGILLGVRMNIDAAGHLTLVCVMRPDKLTPAPGAVISWADLAAGHAATAWTGPNRTDAAMTWQILEMIGA